MEWIILSIYALCLLYVLAFSIVQVQLTFFYRKYLKARNEKSRRMINGSWPKVTVQLPLYNERYVAERLIQSILALDYPSEKLEIQVLDDSTDDTSEIISNTLHQIDSDYKVEVIKRNIRNGYKAGALQNGLRYAHGEYIAVFDADFVPDPSFLKNTIPYFEDSEVGMVQTRWGHLNESFSLLTKSQAFGLNAHFIIEQVGRSHANSFINFNGTAGVWRKKCISDAGGWSSDTLTEDLDLSYRAQMNGWKFKYLEEEISPAELPVMISAVKSQQYRWNKGAAETAKKLLWVILKSDIKLRQKVHAVFHLLNSSVYIPLIILSILSVPALYIKHTIQSTQISLFFQFASIFVLGFAGITWFYWTSIQNTNKLQKSLEFAKRFPVFMSFYIGLSFHNALAVFQGFSGKRSSFVRTPKFNIVSKSDDLKKNIYIKRNVNWTMVVEGVLGFYFLIALGFGIYLGDFGMVPFHLLLSSGFLWIFCLSLKGTNVSTPR